MSPLNAPLPLRPMNRVTSLPTSTRWPTAGEVNRTMAELRLPLARPEIRTVSPRSCNCPRASPTVSPMTSGTSTRVPRTSSGGGFGKLLAGRSLMPACIADFQIGPASVEPAAALTNRLPMRRLRIFCRTIRPLLSSRPGSPTHTEAARFGV